MGKSYVAVVGTQAERAMRRALEASGLTVTTCPRAPPGLGTCALVLVDPTSEGAGIDVVRRSLASSGGPPVVLLDPGDAHHAAQQALRWGADLGLSMRASTAELIAAVHEIIGGQRPLFTRQEARRLDALQACDVLDTEADAAFDDFAGLAGAACEAPIALVSLVDLDRQWFKARVGVDATETPRAYAFCAHAIQGNELFVVPDAQRDPRFADNPLVKGYPHVGSYAGMPLILSDGQAVGTLCVIDHEPRAFDARQLDALRRLGRRAAAELELRRARAAAAASSAAKSAFVATLSHELRTPMNGVLGMADLLLASELAPMQHEQVDIIVQSARALLAIVDETLDISRIEAGAIDLSPERFAPRQLVADVCRLLTPAARAKGLRLHSEVDPAVPLFLLGIPLRIRQILLNLVGNAVKFTADGEVRVRLRLTGRDAGRVEVACEVEDTGPGIASADLGRVFRPFSRVGAVAEAPGTGLGLSISKKLAEAMGGSLTAISAPGKGSTFTLRVRFDEATPPTSASIRPLAAPPGNPRVLVVDDDIVNRKVAEAMLKRLGYEPALAANSREAVELVRGAQFYAVLMDCQMPEMDGFEATRAIRQIEQDGRPRTRVIALTASSGGDHAARCFAAGMDQHVTKPVTRASLAEALADPTAHAYSATCAPAQS